MSGDHMNQPGAASTGSLEPIEPASPGAQHLPAGVEGEAMRPLSVQSWTSASVLLIGAGGLSKLLGFVRELLVAAYFGVSGQVDAYAVAYAVPLCLAGAVGFGFSTTIIPGYHKTVVAQGRAAGGRYLFTNCLASFGWSLLLVSPVWLLPSVLVQIAAPAMSPESARSAIGMMGWLGIYVVVLNLTYVLSAVFHALNHFQLPAVADLLFNISVIGVLAALSTGMGVQSLVIANLCGIVFCLAVLLFGLLWAQSIFYVKGLTAKNVAGLSFSWVPVAGYALLSQVPLLLGNAFASVLGEGSIAALGYGRTIIAAIVTLVATSVARGIFPMLSMLSVEGRSSELQVFVLKLGESVIFIFIPVSILLFIHRDFIVGQIYQRGVFGASATNLAGIALGYLAVGLTFMAGEPILTRIFYSVEDLWSPVTASVCGAAISCAALFCLTENLGLSGVALSASLAAVTVSSAQLVLLARKMRMKLGSWLSIFFLKSASCAAVLALPLLMMDGGPVGLSVALSVLFLLLYGYVIHVAVQPLGSFMVRESA